MNTKTAKTLIITGFGLNCEKETDAAFTLAGSATEKIHLNDLLDEPARLQEFNILAFIGGFSFGDHLGAGTIFANRVKYGLGNELKTFIENGNLIIGICNGFQTITRMGLLPAFSGLFVQDVALDENNCGVFRDAWVDLGVNSESPCVFTKGIERMELPIRHGEGKVVCLDDDVATKIKEQNLDCLYYTLPGTNERTEEFPHNPNGSARGIAGLCDSTGRIFGLMPHPEAYLSAYNHPQWTHQKIDGTLPQEGIGTQIFRNAVEFIQNS